MNPSPRAPGSASTGRGRLRLAAGLLGYNLALLAGLPLLLLWLLWRMVVKRKPLGRLRERSGFVPRPASERAPRFWLHAVSAGEMGAIRPVAEALRRRFPEAWIAISTQTSTGMEMGRKTAAADAVFYLPFDFPDCMFVALRRLRPHLIAVAEKELWPNLLGEARLMGIPVLVVNGRVSDRMMRRARLSAAAARWLHALPDHFCVQSGRDAERLAVLGVAAERVTIAGNTKVDAMAEPDREAEERLRRDLGASGEGLWLVAGSTHPGEEEAVADAYARIRAERPETRLLLAPRHVERTPAVLEMLSRRGLEHVRRSARRGAAGAPVVVLDTMGELRAAYALGAAGFVGGTLAPIGGHNLLEPVAAGRPVLFGPHTENCADVADLVSSAGVGFRVEDAASLAEEFLRLARDAETARAIAERCSAVMEEQRGAAERCARAAAALLGVEEVGK